MGHCSEKAYYFLFKSLTYYYANTSLMSKTRAETLIRTKPQPYLATVSVHVVRGLHIVLPAS